MFGFGAPAMYGQPQAAGIGGSPSMSPMGWGGPRQWMERNPALWSAIAGSLLQGPTFRQGVQGIGANLPAATMMDAQSREKMAQRAAMNAALKAISAGEKVPPDVLSALPPEMALKIAQPEAAASTDDLREYQVAKSQGYPGNFMSFVKEVRGQAADRAPVTREFYDPASKTTKIKQYDYATGQWNDAGYAEPKPGTSFSISPDGTVEFDQGPGVVANERQAPTKPTTNVEQKDIVDLAVQKAQVEHIGDLYDPRFLTYEGKVRGGWARQMDKLGLSGPDDRAFLAKQKRFVQNVEQVFNAYRKDITGAAAALAELDRLKQSVINVDQSPAEFEASLSEFAQSLERGLAIKADILKQGIPVGTPQFSAEFEKRFLAGQRGGEDAIDSDGWTDLGNGVRIRQK